MNLHAEHTPAFEAYLQEYQHLDEGAKERFDEGFEERFGADFAALWRAWRTEHLKKGDA